MSAVVEGWGERVRDECRYDLPEVTAHPEYPPLCVEIGAGGWIVVKDTSVNCKVESPYAVTSISWEWREENWAPKIHWAKAIDRFSVYEDRVNELRGLGADDEIELRQLSLLDFATFIRTGNPCPKASLVLTESGNIRAIWRGDENRQIGIQFYGSGMGSFSILSRELPSERDPAPYGEKTLADLKDLLAEFNLRA